MSVSKTPHIVTFEAVRNNSLGKPVNLKINVTEDGDYRENLQIVIELLGEVALDIAKELEGFTLTPMTPPIKNNGTQPDPKVVKLQDVKTPTESLEVKCDACSLMKDPGSDHNFSCPLFSI